MRRGMVFVTGIHGVGKTTFCEHLARSLALPTFTASSIIRDCGEMNTDPARLNGEVLSNAEIFRRAILQLGQSHRTFFVDGHTVLLDQDAHFVRIPPSIFADLQIFAFVLLYHDVEEVRRRLKCEIPNEPPFLAAFQSAEIEQASFIANQLGLKFLAHHGSEGPDKITSEIERLVNA